MKLYHGSSRKLKILKPKQATGIKKKIDSQTAVYATDKKDRAIVMAMIHLRGIKGPTRISASKGNVMGVIFEGFPSQKYFYLYTLSSDNFTKIDHWQWISNEKVTPLKIEKIKTADYLHLIRKGTKREREGIQKLIKKLEGEKIRVVKLKPHSIKNARFLIKTIIGFLSFRIFKNLGYFQLSTWRKVIKNRNNKKYVFEIICDREYVGMIAITYEHDEGSWNIAYFVFKKYEGMGITTLATKEALKFCRRRKIKNLHTRTNPKNIGSVRVLEKNGFVRLRENTNEIFWRKKL